MTALKDRFWAKVLFSQFIKHYRKMTPEQKVADIDASMDALEELDDTGDSFGAKMVRWSMERVNQYPQASENGKKGGRPRKNQDTTADGDIREDSLNVTDGSNAALLESGTYAKTFVTTTKATTPCTISADGPRQAEARQSQGRTGAPSTGATSSTAPVRSLPMPTTEQLYDFARAESLDEADAREWYEMTVIERAGKDRYGKPIGNWKVTCRRFCEAKAKKRSTQK